jgi:Regulator of chromosome condensation (RCC1) repeat
VAVAAGGDHSLALRNDGSVVGWGGNFDGQATAPSGLSNVVAIAAAYAHSLALRADGTVVAWGYNYYGQTNIPVGLTNVVAISGCGLTSSMALMGNGPPTTSGFAASPSLGPEGFSTRIPTRNGRVYALEYTGSLVDPGWTLLPLVAGTGAFQKLLDPAPTALQRYRVKEW